MPITKFFAHFFQKNYRICKNVQKKFFFCIKFLQIWKHTDFRPREESVSFYEIKVIMILPIC